MALAVVHVGGEAYDQGLQHGAALRAQIAHNLEVYYDRFEREAALTPDEARARAASYVPVLDGHPYYAALLGMAAGTGLPLIDLLVLNLRYELLYYQYGVCAMNRPDGCTAFAVLPASSANAHLWLGQNWDWIPQIQGAALFTEEPDGVETLSFTEAGVVGGKIGLNSAGLGLTINGLASTADDWARLSLPFHVRCYSVLRCRTLAQATAVLVEGDRSCSANFLLAQTPDLAVDLETAPPAINTLRPTNGVLVHTNHFVDPARLGVVEPPIEPRPHSYTRLTRFSTLLEAGAPLSVEDLQAALRDHDGYPDSVCRHEHPDDPPEEQCRTVTSVIMDLDARRMWLTDGPPCKDHYTTLSLSLLEF